MIRNSEIDPCVSNGMQWYVGIKFCYWNFHCWSSCWSTGYQVCKKTKTFITTFQTLTRRSSRNYSLLPVKTPNSEACYPDYFLYVTYLIKRPELMKLKKWYKTTRTIIMHMFGFLLAIGNAINSYTFRTVKLLLGKLPNLHQVCLL